MGRRRYRRPDWLEWGRIRRQLLKVKPKKTCLDCGFLAYGDDEADAPTRERFYTQGQLGGLSGQPEKWRCFRGLWTAHMHYGKPDWEPVLTETGWDRRGCPAFYRHDPGRTPVEHLRLERERVEFRRQLVLKLPPVVYGSLGAIIGWLLTRLAN